jgi:hypothetical protein
MQLNGRRDSGSKRYLQQERQGKQTIPAARETGEADDSCSRRDRGSRRYLQQERQGKQTIIAAGETGEAVDICSRRRQGKQTISAAGKLCTL